MTSPHARAPEQANALRSAAINRPPEQSWVSVPQTKSWVPRTEHDYRRLEPFGDTFSRRLVVAQSQRGCGPTPSNNLDVIARPAQGSCEIISAWAEAQSVNRKNDSVYW
jgi:hypothetical protein